VRPNKSSRHTGCERPATDQDLLPHAFEDIERGENLHQRCQLVIAKTPVLQDVSVHTKEIAKRG